MDLNTIPSSCRIFSRDNQHQPRYEDKAPAQITGGYWRDVLRVDMTRRNQRCKFTPLCHALEDQKLTVTVQVNTSYMIFVLVLQILHVCRLHKQDLQVKTLLSQCWPC